MGLMLSILVVCIGVLEAISCIRHFQHGYLPFWVPNRMRPMINEHLRRKPNEDDADSSDSEDELSRILHNGGGVQLDRPESPSYGLTPILTEHRRNTPILRDEDADGDPSEHPKYVENNIDDSCTGNIHGCLLTEPFRPISPSDLEEAPDESYVSSTGKFLETPQDNTTPQRSSSEETLHESEPDDEIHSLRALAQAACPIDDPKRFENVEFKAVDDLINPTLGGVVFQIDRASPPVVQFGGRTLDALSQSTHGADVTGLPDLQIPFVTEDLDADDDGDYSDDPIYNLLAASANILHNDAKQYADAPYIPRVSSQNIVSQSSCRPLSVDTTARIPTPQSHRESMPFDLIAAQNVFSLSSGRPVCIDGLPTAQTHGEAMPVDFVGVQDAPSLSSGRPLGLDFSLGIPTPQAHRPSMPFDWATLEGGSQPSLGETFSLDTTLGIPTPQAHRPSMPFDWTSGHDESQSSSRAVSLDAAMSIPTHQPHRDSIPLDLIAAQGSNSRPGTPMKSKADISWPVFHPEPVIKRPLLSLSDLNRGGSIDEDFDPFEGSDDVTPQPHIEELDEAAPQQRPPVSILKSSTFPSKPTPPPTDVTDVMLLASPSKPSPLDSTPSTGRQTSSTSDVIGVEEQCSKVTMRSLSSVPSTPFMTVSGKPCLLSHRSHVDDHPSSSSYHTSVDKFGRITCQPHVAGQQRRKSLEHVEAGNLKDSLMSKSLPDFFFEENMAPLQSAASVSNLVEAARKEEDDVSVGKDITTKESSIKRRRSYRDKKRHTSSSSKSPDHIPSTLSNPPDEESVQSASIAEQQNENVEESRRRESIDKVESKAEAILNKELVPEEVLHHGEEKPETGVFATQSQQAKTRLKQPARAESFEEAPLPAQPLTEAQPSSNVGDAGPVAAQPSSTTGTLQTPVSQGDDESEEVQRKHRSGTRTPRNRRRRKNENSKSNENLAVQGPSDTDISPHHSPQTTEQPPPLSAPLAEQTTDEAVAQPNETKSNNDEEDIEYIINDESDTSNVNLPPQSSSQAPFWVRQQ